MDTLSRYPAVSRGSFLDDETDLPFLRLAWRQQLPNGIKYDLELGVVFLFQCAQFRAS
jgi:hypothetical protein